MVAANTVAATSLSIQHNKDLPTPYQLIIKGKILDKTDDIYWCTLFGMSDLDTNTGAKCRFAVQHSKSIVE